MESEDLAHVQVLPVTLGRTQYSWTQVFICVSRDNYPFMQEINILSKRWKEWNLVCASGNSQPRKRSRHITLLSKICLVEAMVFPVVTYGCGCQIIDAFELWCWRRLLRIPWTARKSNQSILKEINPEYSLEALMLKLHTLSTWCK